jgi:hypothetical protein
MTFCFKKQFFYVLLKKILDVLNLSILLSKLRETYSRYSYN